ncbi:MAG: hypothetical protein ACFFDW_17670, partial [Candidatus Thorarchaeota archaeon]
MVAKNQQNPTMKFLTFFNDFRFQNFQKLSEGYPLSDFLDITRKILAMILFIIQLCEKKMISTAHGNYFSKKEFLELITRNNSFILNLGKIITALSTNRNLVTIENQIIHIPYLCAELKNLIIIPSLQNLTKVNTDWANLVSELLSFHWSFDFNIPNENLLNTHLIGLIFESDLALIEHIELKDNQDAQKIFQRLNDRKRQGAYFTPLEVTEFITKNTIYPELFGESINSDFVPEKIISEVSSSQIDKLLEKISQLKILDLSCGSGDFLLQASQILYDILKKIYSIKGLNFNPFEVKRKILLNNIFGV